MRETMRASPGPAFEATWGQEGDSLRARLRDGFSIVVHCKGGLGRAGTVAARLLIELGMEPREAVRQVRAARPGAIETEAQLAGTAPIDLPGNAGVLPPRTSATRSAPQDTAPTATSRATRVLMRVGLTKAVRA